MISRLGLAISRVFQRTCPDPMVIAILLGIVTTAMALGLGRFPEDRQSLQDRALLLLDAWRSDSGIWKLLRFGMQMCLILVTGHALASTTSVRRLIARLAAIPASSAGAAFLVCAVSCLAGLVNWGLGLVVGALLAKAVGRSLTQRGIAVHYPLVVASGYMGLLVFHGGLSASAPLTATTAQAASAVITDPAALAIIGQGIPLDRTLLSPLNLFVTGGLVLMLPPLFAMLTPTQASDMRSMPRALVEPPEADFARHGDDPDEQLNVGIPARLDRSPIIAWLLAAPLLIALARYAWMDGLLNLQLNEVNALMLAAGLVLHGSPLSYMRAVEAGARDCAGIIVQFPIYAGIMGLMTASGMVTAMTQWFVSLGDAQTLPALSFAAATLVGLFVPSGGAQWGLQGPIALQSGQAAGVDPGLMLMSVAYGDELANMLQPFWALPLLSITGAKAREIVGYTAVAMVVAGGWMLLGLLIF